MVDEIDGDFAEGDLEFLGGLGGGAIDCGEDVGGGGVEDGFAVVGAFVESEGVVVEAGDVFEDDIERGEGLEVIGVFVGADEEEVGAVGLVEGLLEIPEIGPEVESGTLTAGEGEEGDEVIFGGVFFDLDLHVVQGVLSGAAREGGILGGVVSAGEGEDEGLAGGGAQEGGEGFVEDAAIVGDGDEVAGEGGDLDAGGGGVGGFVERAAAEVDAGDGLVEMFFEVGMGLDAGGEVLREEAAGGQGIIDGAEAMESEVAEREFYGVANHECAGEDGGGDGDGGDEGEIGEAEVGEGAEEEFEAGHVCCLWFVVSSAVMVIRVAGVGLLFSFSVSHKLAVLHVELGVEEGGEGGAVGDGDDHGVGLGCEIEEQLADCSAGFGVEVAGGFVGEEEGGLVHEGTGDGDALALAAGEFGWEVGGAVGEADFLEEVLGAGDVVGGDFGGGEFGEEDILQRRELGEEVVVLENEADVLGAEFCEGGGIEGEGIRFVESESAGRWCVEGAEDVEQGGFAGAAGAEDGEGIAGIESESDAADDDQGFRGGWILLVQVIHLEGCGHRTSSS